MRARSWRNRTSTNPATGIVVEPSHCPHCKHKLSWYENIPLFSWIIQGGKCRHCKAPISLQYRWSRPLTSVLVLACVWQFGFGWQGFGAIVLTCFLIALSGIDLRTQLLPDQLTLSLMWLGLIGNIDNLYMPAKPAWSARRWAICRCGWSGGCSSS